MTNVFLLSLLILAYNGVLLLMLVFIVIVVYLFLSRKQLLKKIQDLEQNLTQEQQKQSMLIQQNQAHGADKTIQHLKHLQNTNQALRENNILKMYVDSTVLQYMICCDLEQSIFSNETIEATVVFIDICCFTALAENEPPNVVVQILNKYFDLIVQEVDKHQGYIDKFIGDAVMAVFKGDAHAIRAVKSALAVVEQICSIRHEQYLDIPQRPNVCIGINSGEMILGNIGSHSLKRLDHTVIGDVVNTAQRIQSNGGGGEVWVGENTYQLIKQAFVCQDKGDILVKNKALSVKVYQVIE